MKKISLILLFSLLFSISTAFQLQGVWTLAKIQSWPTLFQPVTVQIRDVIYRQTSILQNILFTGCQTYKYLLQATQNNIFVSYSSIQYENLSPQISNVTVKCDQNTAKMHSFIRNKLVQVFYFKLVGNFLVFLDPKNQIVFQFQRLQKPNIRNLRGIWNLYSLKSTSISQKVQIADSQISLCKGKLILGYTLNDKYGFKTRLISNDGCDVPDLEKTLLSSSFSRKIGTSLQIYNSALEVIMLMSFVDDLDLSSAEQARQKAIYQAKLNEQRAAKAKAEAELKAKAQAQTKAKLQAQQISTTLTLSNTKEDLLGLWQPVTISGMPMDGSSIYYIISSNLISYNGGCNIFQFQYTAGDSSKAIQIGQNKSTSNICDVNDDGLYVNGMVRVNRYSVSVSGRQFRLRLIDRTGTVVYELKKTVKMTDSPVTPSNGTKNNRITNNTAVALAQTRVAPPVQVTSFSGLQPGRYVFLILSRRDLPRRFCTITENRITLTGCNKIQLTYTVTGKNQIRMTGSTVSNQKYCGVNNDQVISNVFNSVTSFGSGIETNSYVFRNAKNQDVINLSQF